METKLNVVVLSHTPEFEQNIVRGARLCYSSADIEELRDKVTPENAENFLNMILGLGHGSVLEHSCITFGIEGVSRALTHQLVRHRIASYSQKSQRYVKEGQFSYVVPKAIANNEWAKSRYIEHMRDTQGAYDYIVMELMAEYMEDYARNNVRGEFVRLVHDKVTELWQQKSDYMEYEHITSDYAAQMVRDIFIWAIGESDYLMNALKIADKKTYSKFEKIAIENARYVLPNGCETKIQMTVNVRTLFNFFKERLCDRAQDEIRDLAFEMWKECMKISPTIFRHAVPTCVNGKCKEGKMSCGKMAQYKEKHNTYIESCVADKLSA